MKAARTVVCLGGALAWLSVTSAGAFQIQVGFSQVHPFQTAPKAHPVQLSVDAAGRKVIFNESSVQHARRFAGELLPVPDVPGLPVGALEPLIVRHSGEHGLDPRLVRAVIQVESGYNHRARSNKGAMGLMQLMPETAAELAVRHPFDVEENLRGGITYLRQMIDAFHGSVEMALAAYNAGPGAVERHGGVPPFPDTIDYVQRVMSLYQGAAVMLPARVAAAAATSAPRAGLRPAPYVTRGSSGRLVVTTALSSTPSSH